MQSEQRDHSIKKKNLKGLVASKINKISVNSSLRFHRDCKHVDSKFHTDI